MRRNALRTLVVLLTPVAVWAAFALVGGTPGALYATGAILLAAVLFVRLRPARDERKPLPVRPWNRKARRIEELEEQIDHAVSELADRARTIEELRRLVAQQETHQRAVETTLQAQLAALASRLRKHELELESFEQQLEAAPVVVEPSTSWNVRSRV
jgi:septal ring factor EnvC (AmiA/AmiB activator)